MFNNTRALAIPEGDVVKIECGGIVLWEKGYKNWAKYSTETDDKTIYNNGLGYKNGYRIRSGGAEGTSANASHTGYIPAKANNVVRLSGYGVTNVGTDNAINVYDASHNNIGQIVSNYPSGGYGIFNETYAKYGWSRENGIKEEKTGVWVWTIPPDSSIAYIRVTGYTLGDGSKMIVTVNEEIT